MIPRWRELQLIEQRNTLLRMTAEAWEHDESIDVSNAMYQALIIGLIYLGDCVRGAAGSVEDTNGGPDA